MQSLKSPYILYNQQSVGSTLHNNLLFIIFRNLLIVFTEFIKSFLKYILCLMLIFQVVTAMLQDHCTIFYKGFRKTPILFILIHATNIPVTLRPPDVLPQPYPLAWSRPAPTEYQRCHSHNAGSDAYGNEIQSDRQPLHCSAPD